MGYGDANRRKAKERREILAMHIARGLSKVEAGRLAGYKMPNYIYRITSDPEFKALVEKKQSTISKRTVDVVVHNRNWIDSEMRRVYDRCISPQFEGKPCPTCEARIEKVSDHRIKHAVKLLEMWGFEQGMFKRQLDVTSRKGEMIEGTEDQILDRFAQLMVRLGIPAMAKLMDRFGADNVASALNLMGFEIRKRENGRAVQQLDGGSEGDAGDDTDDGDSDAESLQSVSEAALLS